MTSIRAEHQLTPEMIKYNEATKAQREEILAEGSAYSDYTKKRAQEIEDLAEVLRS